MRVLFPNVSTYQPDVFPSISYVFPGHSYGVRRSIAVVGGKIFP